MHFADEDRAIDKAGHAVFPAKAKSSLVRLGTYVDRTLARCESTLAELAINPLASQQQPSCDDIPADLGYDLAALEEHDIYGGTRRLETDFIR